MGPDQLTGVMDIIAREAAQKAGKKLNEELMASRKEMFRALVEQESDVYYTSSRILGWFFESDCNITTTSC